MTKQPKKMFITSAQPLAKDAKRVEQCGDAFQTAAYRAFYKSVGYVNIVTVGYNVH